MVKSGALSPTCRLIVRLSGSGASMRAIYVRPAAADVNRRRGRDWPDRPRRFRLGGAGTDDRVDAMTVPDRRGLMLSNATADCALALDEALADALAFRAHQITRLAALLAGQPDFRRVTPFRADWENAW